MLVWLAVWLTNERWNFMPYGSWSRIFLAVAFFLIMIRWYKFTYIH
jgi:hypothetical protein